MNKFARLLYEAVKKQHITYRKAASTAGVSPDLLSRIILGNRLPSPKNAVKLAKALGINEQEALMAVNYDKVPFQAKKYFTLPKPRYPMLRELLANSYHGEKAAGKKLFEEISGFQFGSLETLILTRMLIASQSFHETLIEQKTNLQLNRENLKTLKNLLKQTSLSMEDETEVLGTLSRLVKWQSLGPDYSLQVWFAHPDGSCPSFVTGETRMEKPLFSFTNSEPVEVPLLEDKIAAGVPLPISGNWTETRFFTYSFLRKFTDPILIEVGKDQDSMIPIIFPGDLLLLDRKPVEKPKHGHIYAVNLEDGGSVKYCEIQDNKLHITCENRFSGFKSVILNLKDKLLDRIIVGEVVWVGRELPKK
jgi:transcriptional regulator with XRE-family HTH domain